MMSYAQYYSDELSAKIRRGMDYNAEKCLYNGGGVPLGYQIGKDKRFEINPNTAPIVKSIFEMYANGKTVTEITDILNAQGKTYHYYICNGRKNGDCKKKMVNKNYIENLVISECRRLLSAENIRRIAKEVAAICEAEKDTSNLRYLQKSLAENERKQQNAISAIMESDIENVRKALSEQILILESEHKEIEKMIKEEEAPYPVLTEKGVAFFLTQLKKGKITDIKYRKTLISIFVNKIYLYDDRVTITYNSGDECVTISGQLLFELEQKDEQDRLLFLNGNGPPTYNFPLYGKLTRLDDRQSAFLSY